MCSSPHCQCCVFVQSCCDGDFLNQVADEGVLLLRLRGHVFDHLAGELFCDVFEAWLDEHVTVRPFMAGFPDRRAGGSIDQSKAEPHSSDVVAFLADVFPGINANYEECIDVQGFPELDGRIFVGLSGHLETRKVEHQ